MWIYRGFTFISFYMQCHNVGKFLGDVTKESMFLGPTAGLVYGMGYYHYRQIDGDRMALEACERCSTESRFYLPFHFLEVEF